MLKHGMFLVALAAGALSISGYSATVPVNGATRPAESVSASGDPRWTASIRSVTRSRFDAPDSTRDRSYGSAQWTPGDRPAQSNVSVQFSYGGAERVLSWAILFGNCGTGSMTLLPLSTFPEIEVSPGGHAQIDATLLVEFPTSGTYHIDIYRDRQGAAESVVGCGNLRYTSG